MGIVVIGGIIVGSFYLSGINKKTADATAIDDSSSDMSKWFNDSNGSGNSVPSQCGNAIVEGAEECDFPNMGNFTGYDCGMLGQGTGNISCYDNNCTLDLSNCSGAPGTTCGDGVIQSPEQCDGANLNGETCVSIGFKSGTLACYPPISTNPCSFNTSSCTNTFCGDGMCNGSETHLSCPTDCSAPPIADPIGGTYPTTQQVTLSTITPGASIYYTTDGTIPTIASTKYTSKIFISTTTTLNAKTFTVSGNESELMTEYYVITVIETPVANPGAGTYSSPQTIALTCGTPDTNIYYSIQYTSGGSVEKTLYTSPILISESGTLQAQATKTGYNPSAIMVEKYKIEGVSTPIANPGTGIYSVPQTVALSTITIGADIYYTIDGTTPTTSSTLYSSPINVNTSITLKAIAVKDGNSSGVMIEKYEITGQAGTPVANPIGGTYNTPQNVSLSSSTLGANIYYTLDGSTPSIDSLLYSSPINVDSNLTIKAIALKNGYDQSNLMIENYSIIEQASTPIANPLGGAYVLAQNVSLSTSTIGADIYYTLNGSTPITSSTLYTSPININSNKTLKAIAAMSGYLDSNVMVENYIIGAKVEIPVANPVPGTYNVAQDITLTSSTPDAKIYYTIDGSIPTSSSTLYTSPISISSTTTLNAIGIKNGYLDSDIFSGLYTINTSKIIFLTTSSYKGKLGGLAGADLLCAKEASDAGLNGTFKAWLSDDSTSAKSRLTHSSQPYKLVTGTTIADDWDDLTDGSIKTRINIDAQGEISSNTYAWTNTSSNGNKYSSSGSSCISWTNNSGIFNGFLGRTTSTNSYWTAYASVGCSLNTAGLYCIEQ